MLKIPWDRQSLFLLVPQRYRNVFTHTHSLRNSPSRDGSLLKDTVFKTMQPRRRLSSPPFCTLGRDTDCSEINDLAFQEFPSQTLCVDPGLLAVAKVYLIGHFWLAKRYTEREAEKMPDKIKSWFVSITWKGWRTEQLRDFFFAVFSPSLLMFNNPVNDAYFTRNYICDLETKASRYFHLLWKTALCRNVCW